MNTETRILNFSKELRSKQTVQENVLWEHLRAKKFGAKFKRQVVIGEYIVDFASKKKRLAIELDGKFHRGMQSEDLKRTKNLNRLGYTVLRFWNSEIDTDLENVLNKIDQALKSPSPPTPLPRGRGEFYNEDGNQS